MTLRVIGSGCGRTGTTSLKAALEQLLGGPCYHMYEVKPEHVPVWHAAVRGEAVDWAEVFDGYVAAVDWPASAFWPELAARYPDAVIVHSERDPTSWWHSASSTIFPSLLAVPPDGPRGAWKAMVMEMMATRFTDRLDDEAAATAAFARHNAAVLAGAPAEALLIWSAADGWEPLCAALGVAVPDEAFPHRNSTEEFQAMTRARRPSS
jgi:hypothetical protein